MSGDHCSNNKTGIRDTKDVYRANRESIQENSSPEVTSSENEDLRPTEPPFYEKVLERVGPDSGRPISARSSTHDKLLGPVEFNRKIAMWFGEKGFIAMRSFFRASVLNSLQKGSVDPNGSFCSDLDVAIIALITDYLVRNGKFFTLSVYTNEVLRPVVDSNEVLRSLMERISQDDMVERALNQNDVHCVLKFLNLNPHSLLGSEILGKYFQEPSQDLFTIFCCLLKDNARVLQSKSKAVPDDDLFVAFSEGLNDEIGKFQYWFSDFNDQFSAVTVKLKKMLNVGRNCATKAAMTQKSTSIDDNDLWNQVIKVDVYLQKQQERLMKLRDKERQKLVAYAKELEKLHQEMNEKLKTMQDYENSLKSERKLLINSGKGDYCCEGKCSHGAVGNSSGGVPTREASTQCFEEWLDLKGENSRVMRVMEENLELKAILRQQNLRIDSLTKRVAEMSMQHRVETVLRPTQSLKFPMRKSFGGFRRPLRPNIETCGPLASVVRRARVEINNLKDEQGTADLQYERMLHNKLSRK